MIHRWGPNWSLTIRFSLVSLPEPSLRFFFFFFAHDSIEYEHFWKVRKKNQTPKKNKKTRKQTATNKQTKVKKAPTPKNLKKTSTQKCEYERTLNVIP